MQLLISRTFNNATMLMRFATRQVPGTLHNVRGLCQFNDTRWSHRVEEKSTSLISGQNHLISRSLYPARSHRNHGFLGNNIYSMCYSTAPSAQCDPPPTPPEPPKKVTIFQKMKQLTKDYWHILIPVHLVTSLGWVSVLYVAAKNGVDVIALMKYLHISEYYIDLIQNSGAGHWALVYALYKLITPFRYTVTVGGTTLAIRYLNRLGIMKFRRPSTEATPTKSISNASKKAENATSPKNLKSN